MKHETGFTQQAELDALCTRIAHLCLPEVQQDVIAPKVKEISQEAFVPLLCRNLHVQEGQIVDVRSESEYARDGIPTALSLPILDDQERHEVGLLYKRHNHTMALRYALYLAQKKEAAYVEKARALFSASSAAALILYCWRGGGRSAYAAGLLERHGIPVLRLQGGWKGFRRQVQQLLYHGQFTLWPLSGPTGCGKSEVLEVLEAHYPAVPVLHLEAAAHHAASVFGHLRFSRMGSTGLPDQQGFETRLYLELMRRRREDGSFPAFITEMESRKIGSVQVPPALFRALQKGAHIRLHTPMALRVKRLQQEYFGEDGKGLQGVRCALSALTRHVGKTVVGRWEEMLDQGNTASFLEEILTLYYDKTYKAETSQPAREVCSDVVAVAAHTVAEIWQEWTEERVPYSDAGRIPGVSLVS